METYKSGKSPLPETTLAWQMYGAGLENFGRNGKPAELPMPEFGPRELLARTDAIGVCFSDVKLITQGNTHVRIAGRDLKKNPAIPGHEVSLTIVGVGEELQNKFKIGDRFVVQADVYFNGVNLAYGYALPGGMTQYGVIGKEILEGDEGCYLIPLQPETGYAEAALTEPWACVVAAYRIQPRRELKNGGVTLIIGSGVCEFGTLFTESSPKPARILASDLIPHILVQIKRLVPDVEIIETSKLSSEDILPLSQERTGGQGFDDIIVLGTPEPAMVQVLAGALAKDGIMNIVARESLSEPVEIDIGRIHYEGWRYIGTKTGYAADSYKATRDSELLAGGAAWFIGAAGPMGQMHVQRAIALPNPPLKIMATDVDNGRLAVLRSVVESSAKKKGIAIRFVNPTEESLDEAIKDLTGGPGFDDIVCMAPIARLIEEASSYLKQGGLMNIFAGVVRGTMAKLDLSATYRRQKRWVGSSGSRVDDLSYTLHETEEGRLPAAHSLAAIGGMNAMAEGVEAVKSGKFPGKTVIFPQIVDLPLMGLPELECELPNVYAKLEDGKFWTHEAEEELLRSKLPG